jgi:hypothetical protein
MTVKHWKQYKSALVLGACLVVITQFTNCDSSTNNALFQALATACTPDASGYNPCTVQDPTIVQLSIPTNIIVLAVTDNNPWPAWFEVGGSCNEGGYVAGLGQSSNKIIYTLTDPQQGNVTISTTAPTDPPSSCILGKFSTSVRTNGELYCNCPNSGNSYECGVTIGGVTYNVPSTSSVVDYNLQIQLLVTDMNGNQIPPNGVSDTQTMTLQCQQQCCTN